MHDMRYFEKPELARIGSYEAFIKKKDTLSAEDQEAYLEGPEYSAMITREDENNSPDIEKILIQQKELPSGEGFPNKVKGPALAPLSCLFIICHELVDYIIENEKWSYKEFLSRYKSMYMGQYFSKVFGVIQDLDR